jgi:hypothetical protein
MSYSRGWVSKEVGAMMKTVLITGSIALVLALCGALLTLFGPKTPAVEYEYLKFAVMLILFLVILIGSYWFVMVPSGRNGGRENRPVETAKGVLGNPELGGDALPLALIHPSAWKGYPTKFALP